MLFSDIWSRGPTGKGICYFWLTCEFFCRTISTANIVSTSTCVLLTDIISSVFLAIIGTWVDLIALKCLERDVRNTIDLHVDIIISSSMCGQCSNTYRTSWVTSCIFEGWQFSFKAWLSRTGSVDTIWRGGSSSTCCFSPALANPTSALVVRIIHATRVGALKQQKLRRAS